MPSTKRRIDPGVAQQLLAAPQRFGFFQALRILESLFAKQGMKRGEVIARKVRFKNTLALGFPASEIEGAVAFASDGAVLDHETSIEQAVTAEQLDEVHITPAFSGLLGAQGALPLHYTERLAERETLHRDRAARAFLDLFTNRAVALHYDAWKKYRIPLQYELDREERFLPIVLSLVGLGQRALRDRMADGGAGEVFDQAIAHYAGGVGQHPTSAAALQRILRDYFEVPLRIEQFVGAWYSVPPEQRTRLGASNATLGSTALAGERVWQRDLRMRVWIGPLDRDRFDDFLPGGKAAQGLAKWLTLLTGSCFEYEVRLTLKAEHITGVRMSPDAGARLGWDSYVCSRAAQAPRSDTCYDVRTLQ
ncbi:type VI secretion system baseplate subunit TssG [Lysobacter sp. 5GHs7-4]|uniref:type VI secretion system baseplate subunit TssG n=1 Tax=Lysobacter sp. 5GHs7-4 TaxID=2904253 RepID=UPI001E616ABF|nr:type VI secretion system baseplate subunit TssG [Lysobacter sp. 5GHs7-4]UHQ21460.1 type VI secretion system baseplate subunit TssG [Lysobacter sp. 5GHs7-4]